MKLSEGERKLRVHQGLKGRQLIQIQHESVYEIATLIQKCSQRNTKSTRQSQNVLNVMITLEEPCVSGYDYADREVELVMDY
jgi:hypothetical protein